MRAMIKRIHHKILEPLGLRDRLRYSALVYVVSTGVVRPTTYSNSILFSVGYRVQWLAASQVEESEELVEDIQYCF